VAPHEEVIPISTEAQHSVLAPEVRDYGVPGSVDDWVSEVKCAEVEGVVEVVNG